MFGGAVHQIFLASQHAPIAVLPSQRPLNYRNGKQTHTGNF